MHSRALLLFIAGTAAIPVDLGGMQGRTALAAKKAVTKTVTKVTKPDPNDYVEARTKKKNKPGGCLHPTKKKMLGGAVKTGGKDPTPEECMGICENKPGCTGFGVKGGHKNGCFIYIDKDIGTRPKANRGNRCFIRKEPVPQPGKKLDPKTKIKKVAKDAEIAMIDKAEVDMALKLDAMDPAKKAEHVSVWGYTEILTTGLKAGGCEDADDKSLEVYCEAGKCPKEKYGNWKYDWGIDKVWKAYSDDPTPERLSDVGKECRKNCEDLWDGTDPDGNYIASTSFNKSPATCTGFDLDKVNKKCNLFVKVIGMELAGTSVGKGKACYRRNGDWEGDD